MTISADQEFRRIMLSFSLFLVGVIVLIVASLRIAELVFTIRRFFDEYYETIGRPPVITTPFNCGPSWSFAVYVTLGRYRDDDPPEQIVGWLNTARTLTLLGLTLLVFAVVAGFI